MDKMKAFTRLLKRYHFWVLLVVVIIVGVACWYLSAKALADQFQTNEGKINSAFSSMRSLSGEQRHPNDQYEEKMDALIAETQDSVMEAWEVKYEKQGNLFRWPDDWDEDFLATVKNLRPFETKVPYPSEDEILRYDLRELYPGYINESLPELAKRIGGEWDASQAAPGPGMEGLFQGPTLEGEGPAARSRKPTAPIIWNPANQQEIVAGHFDWSRQRDRRPTTLQILYAQEDLWVLTALMEIIAKTNGTVVKSDGTVEHPKGVLPISRVDFIRIGKNARRPQGYVTGTAGGGAARPALEGEMMEGPGAYEAPPMEEMMMEGPEGYMPGLETATADPADGRYVDLNNLPLSGVQLRGTTGDAGVEQAALAVAKRMPVLMQVLIDQKKINKLLTECGNSPLTVEVQQVRYNPLGGSGGGGPTGMMEGRPGLEMGLAGSGAPGKEPDYRIVELYGIISMYNPVNYTALGVEREEVPAETGGDATDTTPADESSTATTAGTAPEGTGGSTAPAATPAVAPDAAGVGGGAPAAPGTTP